MKERRQHQRYEVVDGTMVLAGQSFSTIGQIVNISNDGVLFRYRGNSDITSDACEASIVFDRGGAVRFGPFKFNTRIVADVAYAEGPVNSSNVTKRCHMQFNDLSYHQKLWLEECIRNHTSGPVQPSIR